MPLYRNKEVFELKTIHGIFNKLRTKGGLAQILPNILKRTEPQRATQRTNTQLNVYVADILKNNGR